MWACTSVSEDERWLVGANRWLLLLCLVLIFGSCVYLKRIQKLRWHSRSKTEPHHCSQNNGEVIQGSNYVYISIVSLIFLTFHDPCCVRTRMPMASMQTRGHPGLFSVMHCGNSLWITIKNWGRRGGYLSHSSKYFYYIHPLELNKNWFEVMSPFDKKRYKIRKINLRRN